MGTQAVEVVNKNLVAVEQVLVDAQDQIATMLRGQIAADKFIYVAMDLIRANSLLAKCEPQSVLQCVLEASELGLILTKHLGHGYLIPYKNGALSERLHRDVYECQFQIGYRGFLHLVREADSEVQTVYSRIVWPDEKLEINEDHHQLRHSSSPDGGLVQVDQQTGETSGYRGAYAKIVYKGGQQDFEWMALHEIEKVRRSSKARSADSPWRQWPEEMVKKTPMRRLCKRLNLTPEKVAGVVRDEYRELGVEDGRPESVRIAMPQRKSQQAIAQVSTESPRPPEQAAAVQQAAAPEQPGPPKGKPPSCPKCGGTLKERKGKTGAFYGCTRYPECKGTMTKESYDAASQQPANAGVPTSEEGMSEPVFKTAMEGFRAQNLALVQKVMREQEINSEFYVPLDPIGRLLLIEAVEKAFAEKK